MEPQGVIASPAPAPTGLVPFLGRTLLLLILPLSVLWLPVARIPAAGNVAAGDVALVGLWGLSAVALVLGRWATVDPRASLMVLLAVAIGALAGIGSELTASEGQGVLELMTFMKRFGLASIVPLAAALFRSREMATWSRWLSAGALVALAVFTVFPALQQLLPRPVEWDLEALGMRSTGLLTNPNDLAYAAVALATVHGALLPRRPAPLDRMLLVVTLLAAATCVISSGSRSGVLGAAGALLFLILSTGIRTRTKLALVAGAAVAVGVGLSSSAVFEQRLASAYREGLGEANVYSRLDAQRLAMRTAVSHPFGVGYSGFARAAATDTPLRLVTSDSVYFDTLLGAGFLGLLCYLGLLRTAWKHIERCGAAGDRRPRVLKSGLIAFVLFGVASVVPISVFLSPLFFYLSSAGSYLDDDAG